MLLNSCDCTIQNTEAPAVYRRRPPINPRMPTASASYAVNSTTTPPLSEDPFEEKGNVLAIKEAMQTSDRERVRNKMGRKWRKKTGERQEKEQIRNKRRGREGETQMQRHQQWARPMRGYRSSHQHRRSLTFTVAVNPCHRKPACMPHGYGNFVAPLIHAYLSWYGF